MSVEQAREADESRQIHVKDKAGRPMGAHPASLLDGLVLGLGFSGSVWPSALTICGQHLGKVGLNVNVYFLVSGRRATKSPWFPP